MKKEAVDSLINKFEETRKNSGKSRRELGERLGLHRNTIDAWENDRGRPSEKTLYTILIYLSENTEDVTYVVSQKTFLDMGSKTLWHVREKDDEKIATYGGNFEETIKAMDRYLGSASYERVSDPKEIAQRYTMPDLNLDFSPEDVIDRFEAAARGTTDPLVVGELFKEHLKLLWEMEEDVEWAEQDLVNILVQRSSVFRVMDAIKEEKEPIAKES